MWVRWRAAMAEALYGPRGFYRGEGVAARHFRTSVHASSRFAGAIAELLAEVDVSLRRPGRLDVVDMGSGDGRLLVEVHERVEPRLRRRLRLVGVDYGMRPAELPEYVAWAPEPPPAITGLVVANEWLDNVPVDVVEQAHDGPRLVLVDRESGEERIGGRPGEGDLRWMDRWWPLAEPGDRAEIGWPRDEEWVQLVKRLRRGVAIAIDYGHHRHTRPPYGTLTGYWQGYQVRPVPDGSCDITAHVALDSCASAAGSRLTTQRAALRALGVTGERPPLPQPAAAPANAATLANPSANPSGGGGVRGDGGGTGGRAGAPVDASASVPVDSSAGPAREYLRSLAAASEEAELIDPNGLGAFGWVVHANGIPVPAALRGTISP